MSGFRYADRRYPPPPAPPAAPRPRPVLCEVVDPQPQPHRHGRCTQEAGHEGMHTWQHCLDIDPHAAYECQHQCELGRGHEPPHRATFEW